MSQTLTPSPRAAETQVLMTTALRGPATSVDVGPAAEPVTRGDSIMLRIWLAGCALMWAITVFNLFQGLWNRLR